MHLLYANCFKLWFNAMFITCLKSPDLWWEENLVFGYRKKSNGFLFLPDMASWYYYNCILFTWKNQWSKPFLIGKEGLCFLFAKWPQVIVNFPIINGTTFRPGERFHPNMHCPQKRIFFFIVLHCRWEYHCMLNFL